MNPRRRPNPQNRYRNQRNKPQGSITPPPIMPNKSLDINCNLGQGFGIFQNDFEERVIPYVTSVNIACGAHSGDPLSMARAIELAKEYDISVGALIGYNDLIGNGH